MTDTMPSIEHLLEPDPASFDLTCDAGVAARSGWRASYRRQLVLLDALILAAALAIALVLRFGLDPTKETSGGLSVGYGALGLGLGIGWMVALQAMGARHPLVIGVDSLEYARVANATLLVFGLLAIVSLIAKVDMSRGYLAVAFPLGLGSLLVGRKVARVWLRGARRRGDAVTRVLVVGSLGSALTITDRLQRDASTGMTLGGVWVPGREGATTGELGLNGGGVAPVFGCGASLGEVLEATAADMVIVADPERIGHAGLKELSWQLSGTSIQLMVSPNMLDVSGARVHLTAVSAMPFMHVAQAQYESAAAWPKVLFDRVGAAVLLVLLSPFMAVVAAAIKLTSAGSVFYRQDRIGRDGQPFRMTKFRSMCKDSDRQLAALVALEGNELAPLAKIVDDPRVTPVGRFIRRFSIDELPQLFDVLRGDMSLVGPRPQREFEVATYDRIAQRRLRVRPGMTGLWQVSGRSDLSWEDAIRLDTYYVENWSLVGDLMILWKTVRAVVASEGAY